MCRLVFPFVSYRREFHFIHATQRTIGTYTVLMYLGGKLLVLPIILINALNGRPVLATIIFPLVLMLHVIQKGIFSRLTRGMEHVGYCLVTIKRLEVGLA